MQRHLSVLCLFLSSVLLGFLSSFAEADTNVPNTLLAVEPVVPPTITRPALRPERAVFLVECDDGRGSGFLMQESNQVYFVSNMHVLSGGTNFSIKNVYGETISVPDTVQVASDRDLIRFAVDFPGGLPIATDYGFGDALCAFGNSGGEGVITRLDGTVMALGPKLIEVSCAFIPGNSGGPVLDKSNQVVCVSTFISNYTNSMPNWILEGSRFKETRRMAVRVDNVEWLTMSWSDFCRESAYVDQIEEYSYEMIWIVKTLSDDKFEMMYSDTDSHGIQSWIKNYNQYVRSAGKRLKKEETKTTVSYTVSPRMKQDFKLKIKELSKLAADLKREIKLDTVTIPFFKEKLEQSSEYFERCSQQMETVVETLL